MNIQTAIDILKPRSGNIEDLAAAFTSNVRTDGAEEAFNLLWEIGETTVNDALISGDTRESKGLEAKRAIKEAEDMQHIHGIIEKIKHLEGIEAEICGKWLWVSGETRQHANTLKGAGLKFARKKVKWYWRPDGYKRRNKRGKTMPMSHIRDKYGSQRVEDN